MKVLIVLFFDISFSKHHVILDDERLGHRDSLEHRLKKKKLIGTLSSSFLDS